MSNVVTFDPNRKWKKTCLEKDMYPTPVIATRHAYALDASRLPVICMHCTSKYEFRPILEWARQQRIATRINVSSYITGCCKKVIRFDDNTARKPTHFGVYKCAFCEGYHVGHFRDDVNYKILDAPIKDPDRYLRIWGARNA